MKQDLLHIKILKIVLGIIGCFFAVFVYSFMGSRMGGGEMSAEAYGYDSLEYTAEPVMQICVWKRNERKREDYPGEDSHSLAFFDAVPLELKEGASVSTGASVSSSSAFSVLVMVTMRSFSLTFITRTPFDGLAHSRISVAEIRIIMPSDEIRMMSSSSCTTRMAAT